MGTFTCACPRCWQVTRRLTHECGTAEQRTCAAGVATKASEPAQAAAINSSKSHQIFPRSADALLPFEPRVADKDVQADEPAGRAGQGRHSRAKPACVPWSSATFCLHGSACIREVPMYRTQAWCDRRATQAPCQHAAWLQRAQAATHAREEDHEALCAKCAVQHAQHEGQHDAQVEEGVIQVILQGQDRRGTGQGTVHTGRHAQQEASCRAWTQRRDNARRASRGHFAAPTIPWAKPGAGPRQPCEGALTRAWWLPALRLPAAAALYRQSLGQACAARHSLR